jgi:hypothetical protein
MAELAEEIASPGFAGARSTAEGSAESIDAAGFRWMASDEARHARVFGVLIDAFDARDRLVLPVDELRAQLQHVGQRFVALLVLDPDGAMAFSKAHGLDLPLARLVEHDAVRGAVDRAIAAANEKLSRVEQIKRYALLADEWLPGGDELTPTMKLKRKPIAAKYAARIEALYTE